VGTLASGLAPVAEGLTEAPRVYCDANLPAGLVGFMRERLGWDVLFVIEEDSLRRAPDIEHFRLAAQLRRTLVTLDRDYLDDSRFPPEEGSGVLVLSAPHEEQLERLVARVDRVLFRTRMPLVGRKLHVHTDWEGNPISG
jgi:predicted nuclease of predicted toxin-antitoxin system